MTNFANSTAKKMMSYEYASGELVRYKLWFRVSIVLRIYQIGQKVVLRCSYILKK